MTFRNLLSTGQGLHVGQWHESGDITFVLPEAYVDKPFTGNLLRIEHSTYLSLTTERHNIVKLHPVTGAVHRREAWDRAGTDSWHIPRFGRADGPGINLTDDQIRLQVAFQADGCFDRSAVKWGFTKERKIERLKGLLKNLDLAHTVCINSRDDTVIRIVTAAVPDYLDKQFNPSWVGQMSADQRRVFIDELVYWDGTPTAIGVRYTSMSSHNRDFVQALATSSGLYTAAISGVHVDIHLERTEKTSQKSAEAILVPYTGNVCCVQVPTGMIVVRQEGFATISGNCHAMSFHDSDPDLLSAGDELQAAIAQLRPLYELFPNVDLIDSNHGSLLYRKGLHHGIPRKYLRDYNEVLDAPDGWVWHMDLSINIPGGNEVYFHHGLTADVMKLVAQRGVCAVQGHFHGIFKIGYLGNPNHLLWGMQVGCSIDGKSMAFAYDRNNLARPIIGHGLIERGLPKLLPMILNKDHRWSGLVP